MKTRHAWAALAVLASQHCEHIRDHSPAHAVLESLRDNDCYQEAGEDEENPDIVEMRHGLVEKADSQAGNPGNNDVCYKDMPWLGDKVWMFQRIPVTRIRTLNMLFDKCCSTFEPQCWTRSDRISIHQDFRSTTLRILTKINVIEAVAKIHASRFQ